MQQLTKSLIPILATAFLIAGCDRPLVADDPKLPFCDAEEPRVFTRAEVEWRSANAPANLRKDLKTNTTGERECGWFGEDGA